MKYIIKKIITNKNKNIKRQTIAIKRKTLYKGFFTIAATNKSNFVKKLRFLISAVFSDICVDMFHI